MSLEDCWYEIRIRTTDDRWTYMAGPLDEEAAQTFVDSLTAPGRLVAIVKCKVWAEATL